DKVKEFSDGTIVYLTNILKNLEYDFTKNNLKNRDIILVANKENKKLNLDSILKELESIECLVLLDKNILNKSILEEYALYKDELIEILKSELTEYFSIENSEINYFERTVSNVKMIDITNEYLNEKYKNYITINYELINKDKLSAPMKKVRVNLIDMLLNNDILLTKDEFYSETGAINSVARTVLSKIASIKKNKITFKKEWSKLSDEILSMIKEQNYSLEEIYQNYTTAKNGFGLRNGVFTLFIGVFLAKNKNILLVVDEKTKQKQSLTSDLLEKIEKNNSNYYLSYAEKSKEEEDYLNDMKQILGIYYSENPEIENGIMDGLKNYFYSISRIINKVSLKECKVLSKIFNGLFLDKNAHEFLFKEIPERARIKDYKEIIAVLSNEINYLEDEKIKIENRITEIINDVIGENDSIQDSINNWQSKDYLLDNGIKTWLKKYNYKSDKLFLMDITSKIKGFNYENWSSLQDIEDFEIKLKGFLTVKEVSNVVGDESIQLISGGERIGIEIFKEHTPMGKILKTKLQATIKAMGLSIKDEEKKSILLEILKEM
ncbi:MAG: hypothetical protein ACRDAS_09880, partial [Cetobacterium sp.]